MDLRDHARTVLVEASSDGRLVGALRFSCEFSSPSGSHGSHSQDFEGIRHQAEGVLLEATARGQLTHALEAICLELPRGSALRAVRTQRAADMDNMLDENSGSRDVSSLRPVTEAADERPAKAFRVGGSADGHRACGYPAQDPTVTAPPTPPIPPPPMRSPPRLLLEPVASSASVTPVELTRLHHLESQLVDPPVLAQQQNVASDMALSHQARVGNALLQAHRQGRLLPALDALSRRPADRPEPPSAETERIRAQALRVLIDTHVDGRLFAALLNIRERSSNEHLRVDARASSDGQLSSALEVVLTPNVGSDSDELHSQARDTLTQARDTLIQANASGALARALASLPSSLDDNADGGEAPATFAEWVLSAMRAASVAEAAQQVRFTRAMEQTRERARRLGPGAVPRNSVCTICFELLDHHRLEENEFCLLPCLHAFHPDCAERWLQAQITCPNCRVTADS